MDLIGISSRWLSKLLELFQQKAFVYVDVSFGAAKPYVLTVLNRSNFDVHLNYMRADPDGFPSVTNGWSVNEAGLFREKILKPSQRIRLCLSDSDIGELGVHTFVINYSTIICGKRIPRYEQTCSYDFDRNAHTLRVTRSVSL